MVQIAKARIELEAPKDEYPGKYITVSAYGFDKQKYKGNKCLCPDPNCSAELSRVKGHKQIFYGIVTGKPFQLDIAAHFKRKMGADPHIETCTAVAHYQRYQTMARNAQGRAWGDGVFTFNLNIPTDTVAAPLRQNRSTLYPRFFAAAQDPSSKEKHPPRKLSEGLNSVKAMAKLLDETEFNHAYRDKMLFRNGTTALSLSDLYKSDSIKFFNEMEARARDGLKPRPTLIEFKPLAAREFHSRSNLTIQGLPSYLMNNGHRESRSMMLHCTDVSMYKQITQAIYGGERSFLIYSDSAFVDLMEVAQKEKDIKGGTAKNKTFFVNIPVASPEQIHAWQPMPALLSHIAYAKPAAAPARQLAAE